MHVGAMRYGALPIVRAVGGLNDTVREGAYGNGSRFTDYTPEALSDAVRRALACYAKHTLFAEIQARNMREDFTWQRSSKAYIALYEHAIARHKGV